METRGQDYKRHGKSIAIAILVLFLGGVMLLWGWNTFAVELLAQQPMQFKHALALELFLLAVAGTAPLAWRLLGAHRA